MDILQKIFNKTFKLVMSEFNGQIDSEKIKQITENVINTTIPKLTENLLTKLKKSSLEMLKSRRELSDKFVVNNYNRWSKGFDLFEMLIVMCSEAGESFSINNRPNEQDSNYSLVDTLIRLHARGCHISSEILCLLKNGYADGAHTRWRALHEVVSTAYFIQKHGEKAAIRFLDHEIIESYKGMLQYHKYENRLNIVPICQAELSECKASYDAILTKYGKEFKENYGWASIFLNNKRPNFSQIEADVGLDHMRPYYKWASHNVHANVKGITSKLGLCESNEDVLLVGQSNSGMTDPAHATAIALVQITSTLLISAEPSIDSIVTTKLIGIICDEIGDVFIQVDT